MSGDMFDRISISDGIGGSLVIGLLSQYRDSSLVLFDKSGSDVNWLKRQLISVILE